MEEYYLAAAYFPNNTIFPPPNNHQFWWLLGDSDSFFNCRIRTYISKSEWLFFSNFFSMDHVRIEHFFILQLFL